MKEQIEAILSSGNEFKEQLRKLAELFNKLKKMDKQKEQSVKERKYYSGTLSISDFESVGLFAD